ncbi:MAG: ribosome-associated translation inhibitor RaiA [Candidatus Cloacimonetes bacterium]|jgi:putative sigma-54 modulation protein|nr:ribosome-associated translation inhibitor RaiA [Candidatus Cloacimonadota bacterium]MBT6993467.1 ribosome-associated translation inhibitor RaiA [Candidatus Cloacimonadota bacterium]MBT7469539.1 ribosome-associated translation inhibitor RaiA [Candidatus Cloacimonadota bacterium]
MQITITARHFDLTDAIRDHVYANSERIEKFFDHIIDIHFVLSFENNRSNVELLVHAPKHTLKSEVTEKDMYLAIDEVIDKMVVQIKKMKSKWNGHHKKSLKENAQFVQANLIEKTNEKKVVNIKRIFAEGMTINDAIDHFEGTKKSYLIFKNLETDRINVLIKKDDEHYKLIEP